MRDVPAACDERSTRIDEVREELAGPRLSECTPKGAILKPRRLDSLSRSLDGQHDLFRVAGRVRVMGNWNYGWEN
jgi:hypothetical protein